MLHLGPPQRLTTTVIARLPDRYRQPRRTSWADANRAGQPTDCFLEGPSFDRAGNLHFVDIPNGRIFRLAPDGTVDLVVQYDGWPNGLKIARDGTAFIADYRRGLMRLDLTAGTVEPVLETRASEGFKGLNDLFFAANGDLYFTDQGQTGLHDPTGRVFRLDTKGRLDLLIATVPSPNGLVMNLAESALYLAVTRANAVWRLPILADGSIAKAGNFIQMSGGLGGPDGMALDEEGGLVVCHLGTGVWRFDTLGFLTHVIEPCEGNYATNVAFGGPGNKHLYITESATGTIQVVEMPVAGKPMFSHAG